jgi:hypothetical protein
MVKFPETERKRQTAFKLTSPYFTDAARNDGLYRGHSYPFALPEACGQENLFAGIRSAALRYFSQIGIHWHALNHLCSSQVCCVNFLYPFMDQPHALAELLRPLYPNLRRMLPIESPEQYVAFEWIGEQNYLGERVPGNGRRTRGANFTSADAMVLFERDDGSRQIVLIEWKYTESYASVSKKIAGSGTDRMAIYRHLYECDDCPFDKNRLPGFDALFYEPFYQLMRQQFLAHEMERAHELDAAIVSVLHITPAHNTDFGTVTSPELRSLGTTVTGVWKRLVNPPDRFASVATEKLFGEFKVQPFPQLSDWWEYIQQRYSWIQS